MPEQTSPGLAAPQAVQDLIAKFSEHQETYRKPGYNESQLRADFLDPLFIALGWDVYNANGDHEAYRDVILEQALKVEKSVRAPDYCFRIGGTPKFFVEAKKPSVDIKTDVSPAFQLRRYAWTAKLPLSILTDFEEIAVYDCRIKPDKDDKASTARVMYFKYTDLVERWDEFAGIFSRDAIRKGSFDKYAESNKKKRGTAEVDAAFLEEIESWRESLAKSISLRNDDITDRELNYAVQLIIDRIIFLRMCEGRGIEPYAKLQSIANGPGVYPRLVELFHRADEKYNSGLFHFSKEKGREEPDRFTTQLAIDDKVFKDIFKRLYYPESPYEFAAMPAEILGQVYEQFLGKVIVRSGRTRVRVEDKPEVKKAGGVYYTPSYIVDYIVENTVGKLLEGKTPQEVGGLTKAFQPAKNGRPITVLDPACGSGSFLIVAYQYLLDWYLKQYLDKNADAANPEQHAKGKTPRIYQDPTGDWRLTGTERKRILLAHIYGVDIDYQACEVTKLSLLLKVLEGESEETLQRQARLFHKERALPDLANNIKCGNSLIAPDIFDQVQLDLFDEEDRQRINVFDWQSEFRQIFDSATTGFDAVIGNPPYDVLEKDRGKASWPHEALLSYVRVAKDLRDALGGKLNLFRFFSIRSLSLARLGGRFGMIMPLSLLGDISCHATRKSLLSRTSDAQADCFPQKDNPNRRVFRNAKLSTFILTCTHSKICLDPTLRVRTYPWNSFSDAAKECSLKWSEAALLDPNNVPIPLVDKKSWTLCKQIHKRSDVKRLGVVSGIDITRGEINQTIYREFITSNASHARLVKGVEIGRFHQNQTLSQGEREWLDEARFLKVNNQRDAVDIERIATQRITGVDEKWRIVAAKVQPRAYFADSTNSICINDDSPFEMPFILGLLNSHLMQWRFKLTSTNNNVGTNELESLPLIIQSPSRTPSYSQIAECAKQLEANWNKLHSSRTQQESTAIRKELANLDRRLNELVYQLYELTPQQISMIEDCFV